MRRRMGRRERRQGAGGERVGERDHGESWKEAGGRREERGAAKAGEGEAGERRRQEERNEEKVGGGSG